jgi:hypothetical protein
VDGRLVSGLSGWLVSVWFSVSGLSGWSVSVWSQWMFGHCLASVDGRLVSGSQWMVG